MICSLTVESKNNRNLAKKTRDPVDEARVHEINPADSVYLWCYILYKDHGWPNLFKGRGKKGHTFR
jgi:hypothetical protein